MIVYHTSYVIVEHPDVAYSREYLDFGKGFYLTPLREQAVKYAQRFLLRGKKAYLNTYQLDDELLADFKGITFESYDEAWLDFVGKCRKGEKPIDADYVKGGVADDKVFTTIDLYFAGELNKMEALKRLVYEKPNWQICLSNQKVIEESLRFIQSEEITL